MPPINKLEENLKNTAPCNGGNDPSVRRNGIEINILKRKNVYKKEKSVIQPAKVTLKDLQLLFNQNTMCINGNFIVGSNRRYGLTGLDSEAKTTMLEEIEKRALHIPYMDVIYSKNYKLDEKLSIFNAVLKPSDKYDNLVNQYERLNTEQELLAGQNKDNRKKEIKVKLAELKKELLMFDPEDYPAKCKAQKILSGLGISQNESEKPMKNLSENIKTRANLARALFLEPDLLLLNEPTSDLDLDAILWLGNFLQVYKKTLIVVSQDRCFLDKICNKIIHIDQQDMIHYEGSFSAFEEKYMKKQEKKFKLEANGKSGDANVKTESRVLTRSRSLEEEVKMDDSKDNFPSIQKLQKPEFSFSDPVSLRVKDFVDLNRVTFGLDEKKPLFENLRETINGRSRVAILGPSKAGKSTLIRLATKELDPQKGKVELEDGIKIGFFGENSIGKLPENETPLQYLQKKAMEQKVIKKKNLNLKVAEHLGRLKLVDSSHSTKMKDLSDSEKARVSLAELCIIPHDCLFMDEPTRYLDIDMIDSLTDAINRFNGGLWMVSNNEYLIRETDCEFGFIEGGRLNYAIDFDDYKKKLLSKLDEPVRGPCVYKRRTSSKIVTTPKLVSSSVIIENYIKNSGADSSI